MRALTVLPGRVGSLAVTDVPDPEPGRGELLVDGIAVGVCGTDLDIIVGGLGFAPPGEDRLVLGHESLGRVRQAPRDSGFAPGDLVAGVVRRPDPVPCGACAHGEFDMCRNGRFTERGIRGAHGFGSDRWVVEPGYAVRLDPRLGEAGVLLEPASVVAKAWEQIERIGSRSWSAPRTVLITGAGPIGLLAALLATRRGLEVHVLDEVSTGPKPDLVARLGATYHHEGVGTLARTLRPDIVVEATGAATVATEVLTITAPYGIVCLTGVSAPGQRLTIDAGDVNRGLVLDNVVVFGTVNSNLRHYRLAADALANADIEWLSALITRRVPLERATEAFERRDRDVKVVIHCGLIHCGPS
jgi:threonine dehydrogenase-like Zn-dependent dehydrogenase